MTRREYRDLGMDRRIPRRDFLNGVAIGVAGVYASISAPGAWAQPAADPATYPPARTGLRGHYPSAVADFPAIERGDYARYPGIDVDTRERYDLVIVSFP